MFSSNYIKSSLVGFTIVMVTSSCGLLQNKNSENTQPDNIVETKQTAPFSTAEPAIFQTVVTVSTYSENQKSEKKYFIAKNRLKSYLAFNYGEENETALLETADNRTYILNKKNKTYVEKKKTESAVKANSLEKFLTTKWLNEKRAAKFENLGKEKNLTKYRVIIEDSKNSEMLIFVDENLQIPVRQELYSVSGEDKTLTYSMEISEFKNDAPDDLFNLPEGYQDQTPG